MTTKQPNTSHAFVTPFDLERALMKTKLELLEKFDEELEARGIGSQPNRAAESTPAYGRRNRKKKPDAPQSSTSTPTPAS